MRNVAMVILALASAAYAGAQGPCTEQAVKDGKLHLSADAFSYMPPYGKPVSGKAQIQDTAQKKFGARTNIKRSWESDHKIVASESGEMAYEHGTMDLSYDEEGKPHSFKAVILQVYKAQGGACEAVAETMQPLEENEN